MWGKDDITILVKSILDGSALGSFGQGGGDFLEEGATGNTNIKQCLRKVADGHFTAAVKVLTSSGIDSVFSCIKSFPKSPSCGRDGLRAQHILDALCGEGSATATDLLKVITSVVNLWLAGRYSPILVEFVASAPLTPLLKPDNRIRPIAVGTIWRRLVSKVAMKGVGKEMSNCKLFLYAWYLDDGTFIGDSEEVARVLDIIKGVKLLVGAVSRDADFISGLAMRRVANAFDLMGLLPYEMVKDTEIHFDMTMRQKAVFECLRAPHAQDFLIAISIDGLSQHMSPVEYRTILKYRLMISLFSVDAICPVCRKACLDSFGEHVAFGWVGGKHAYVDLTWVSPLVRLSNRGFTVGQAALKAASGKVTKHEKAYIKNQHVFIPFAFNIFGFFAPEAVELLSRVQWVIHSNVMTSRSTDVVFKRIGFAIQKGLTTQLVARLPSTTM
nr:hAT dimerization domain, ribonuclease H-like domain protein [Tanacetum cinerariifolium]